MAQQPNTDHRKPTHFEVAIEPELQRLLKPRKRWPRMLGLSALGICFAGVIGFAAMNFDAVSGIFGEMTPARADAATPARPDSPFLRHVEQAGLKACSNVYPVLGKMLTNGTKYEVRSSWSNHSASIHAIQSLVGMEYSAKQYRGPAAGVVFAAPDGSGCGGSMVRVVPFAATCDQIPALLPAKSERSNELGHVTVYQLPGNGGEALLLPAGRSCVVISVASAATR